MCESEWNLLTLPNMPVKGIMHFTWVLIVQLAKQYIIEWRFLTPTLNQFLDIRSCHLSARKWHILKSSNVRVYWGLDSFKLRTWLMFIYHIHCAMDYCNELQLDHDK